MVKVARALKLPSEAATTMGNTSGPCDSLGAKQIVPWWGFSTAPVGLKRATRSKTLRRLIRILGRQEDVIGRILFNRWRSDLPDVRCLIDFSNGNRKGCSSCEAAIETATMTGKLPGPCDSVGVHENCPKAFSEAPVGPETSDHQSTE